MNSFSKQYLEFPGKREGVRHSQIRDHKVKELLTLMLKLGASPAQQIRPDDRASKEFKIASNLFRRWDLFNNAQGFQRKERALRKSGSEGDSFNTRGKEGNGKEKKKKDEVDEQSV